MTSTTEQPEVAPIPRVLPAPPPPKKGAKPDPNAAFVGPDGFVLLRPRTLEHGREIVFARFSPCGKFLFAGGYDGRVYRWTLDGDQVAVFEGHAGWMQGLAFHPELKVMYTGDSWGNIIAWKYSDDIPKHMWKRENCHSRWMRSLAINPDGQKLATCGADRVVRLWSTADGRSIGESAVMPDDLMTVHFGPTTVRDPLAPLFVGDLKGAIRLFPFGDVREPISKFDASVLYARPMVQGFREINDVGGVRCMLSDPKGKYLFAAGTQPATSGFLTGKPTTICFDFATGKALHTWQWDKVEPADGIVMDLQWHPAGYVLAASSGQPGKGAIAAWKPGEAAAVYLNKTMIHPRTTAIHPDGKRVAVVQIMMPPGGGTGNGRKLSKDGEYNGMMSQVKVFETWA